MAAADDTTTAAVPRKLSPAEVELFLLYNKDDPTLLQYLRTQEPPWGIVFVDRWGAELLVYSRVDRGGDVHVVDVTGNPIVDEIARAPYHSPDDVGFFENLVNQVERITVGAQGLLLLGAAVLVLMTVRDLTRR